MAGDLSYGQLEQLWISAGGSKALAPLMAAIALAESGGNPDANNYTDNNGTQTSWGLWQVSDGTHDEYIQGLNDPLTNAKAAVAKYKQQGLSAWGTYDSGAYQQYYRGGVPPSSLPQGGGGGQDATLTGFNPLNFDPLGFILNVGQWLTGGGGGGGKSSGPGGVFDGITAIASDFNALLKNIEWLLVPSHWVRIFCGITGVALFIPGMRAIGHAGDGSMQLAIGILEITIASALLFIAFHNLPDDVKSLDELMGYISAEMRGTSTKTTGAVNA